MVMEMKNHVQLTNRALYLQVYDLLASRIVKGEVPEGTYLPNEYDLSRELEVSIGTIRKAVDLLSEAQLVIRQQGKGTLVADRRWLAIRERLNRIRFGENATIAAWQHRQLAYESVSAGTEIGQLLEMDSQDAVHRINWLRTAQPDTKVEETVYIPVAKIPDIVPDAHGKATTASLAKQNNIVIGRVEEKITAVLASEKAANIMSIEVGAPLLKLIRLTYTDRDEPFEYRISYCSSEDGFYWSVTT